MPLSRRHLLHSSLLGSLAFALPLGARAQSGPARKLLLVTCNGGWDVSFHLDPKPSGIASIDVPVGVIRSTQGLTYMDADVCGGVVDDFMVAHADVSSIVRGISVRSISHDVCLRRLMTGSPSEDAPDMGVIAGATHGGDLAAPYLALGAVSFPGNLEGASVRQGFTNQLALAHRYAEIAPDLGANFPTLTEQQHIDAYLAARGTELKNVVGQHGKNQRKSNDYLASIDRVRGLAANQDALGIPFATSLSVTEQVEDALNMLQRGMTWAVNLSTGFAWDHHDPSAAPTGTYDGAQGFRNQELWPALTFLANELKTRAGSLPGTKMIDETVVVVLSEMTRTPKKNAVGGKDHWPYSSALVFGAGVRAGTVLGETNDQLISVPIDYSTGAASTQGNILESNNFVAGVLTLLGVDAELYLPGVPEFSALRSS